MIAISEENEIQDDHSQREQKIRCGFHDTFSFVVWERPISQLSTMQIYE
jgi:hypothetical protein